MRKRKTRIMVKWEILKNIKMKKQENWGNENTEKIGITVEWVEKETNKNTE